MVGIKRFAIFILWALMILTPLSACKADTPNQTIQTEEQGSTSIASTESIAEPIIEEYLNSDTISKYTIVYSSYNRNSIDYAYLLRKNISDEFGVSLTVSGDEASDDNYQIVIGGTALAAVSIGYDDFKIFTTGNSIFINAGNKYAFYNAADLLLKKINTNTPYSELSFTYTALSRDEYINDCSGLIMHWAYTAWQSPDWMLAWDEKLSRLCDPSDPHVFTISHRGDYFYYPENSIESIISVYKMGGDAVEIDVQATSDGHLVLMHDTTLTRMTNYLDFAGKTVNGIKFPNSANVGDWTLEQLSYLCLKEGQGGGGAAITPYRIPTLEEALIFCKDRLFIVLDKPANWRYVEIDGIMPKSAPNYLYPLMVKTDNFSSILISYGTLSGDEADTLNAEQALQIQKYIMDNSGQKCYLYLRAWTTRGTAAPYANTFEKNSLTNSALLVNGQFEPENTSKNTAIKAHANKYKNTRLGGWTITDNTDIRAVWEQMYDVGFRMIMVNNIMELIKFAAEIK